MSLFGSSASGAGGSILSGTSAKPGGLFGTSTTTTASAPLFGATTTTTSAATTGGLFGTTSTTAAPAGGLFGSTAAPATSTAAPAATGSLFGTTATTTTAAPTTGGLFGSAAPAATPSLFGAAPAAAATTTTGGSLFGAAKPAGGLFGATAAAPAAASTGVSLFGTPTTSTANVTLGLGGTQQKLATGTIGATSTTLTAGGEKEAVKDGEIAGAAQIRELLPLIEASLKKNREIMEDVENTTIDTSPISIDEMIDKTRTWINESRRNIREASDMATYVATLVSDDKQFLDTAKKLQDASTTSNQTTLCNTIKSHLFELTNNYDAQMLQMQKRVEGIHSKFERLLNGESALTMSELDEMFKRCDKSYATAQYHIHETGREIEALKNVLIEQGYTHLRKSYQQPFSNITNSSTNEGAEFFPSQSSLAVIGSSLRAAPQTTAPITTGLGLGTTGGLFGSTGGGTSLFGSTTANTATKPLFGATSSAGTTGGSLFGNLTTSATSTTAPATTGASLFGAKPTATSTVTNNSSGLLFSMKK
ncbi:unnamed protein product [Caenorhabditis angaria]|uniref:Uncharacterized protein n=1 Tax=Caenorhabditis angaria TaxID=860376 RepID=A0A9P1I2I5_9PELO|nr:unnamed protein product [Caenorhabditis angaria]